MKIQDTRPPTTRRERFAVVARDAYMSGWGEAEGGASWAALACKSSDDAEKVARWLESREEMKDIQTVESMTSRDLEMCIVTLVSSGWMDPKHLAIYNVGRRHRALKAGAK
jgi:hypothetical protein